MYSINKVTDNLKVVKRIELKKAVFWIDAFILSLIYSMFHDCEIVKNKRE